jgi:hypothetical protein
LTQLGPFWVASRRVVLRGPHFAALNQLSEMFLGGSLHRSGEEISCVHLEPVDRRVGRRARRSAPDLDAGLHGTVSEMPGSQRNAVPFATTRIPYSVRTLRKNAFRYGAALVVSRTCARRFVASTRIASEGHVCLRSPTLMPSLRERVAERPRGSRPLFRTTHRQLFCQLRQRFLATFCQRRQRFWRR